MDNQGRHEEYDSEPVRYCARCYSLRVKYDADTDAEYCDDCGCTDILESSFDEWEKRYENRFKHKFCEKSEDPKKNFIFSLSLRELREKVYESSKWKEIIKGMFPHFPGGYSKADSVILFFDTVIRQNKIEELKLLLIKLFK
jgi:hypothetical protein